MPRVVLEAMAIGRPIITTDAPGCRESIIDSYNGFIVPPMDSLSLANAIEKFIMNEDLIDIMGPKSRILAQERFDVSIVNNQIINEILPKLSSL